MLVSSSLEIMHKVHAEKYINMSDLLVISHLLRLIKTICYQHLDLLSLFLLSAGFQRHFVPLDCLVEAFPQRFIFQPDLKLPLAKLNGAEFPVPHEGHEIMMYIYPETWHLVRKPAGCT